ncbi:hypothetical protein [Roseinatronobacter sp. S2]|uniref:hypothetical protein n=1 Tax=Roseinatronobacter sp. S2 TaxID=3035471 RepID=UPI00240F3551|nr:hypothetical protein [Roseinatronobacter sp. S2]WFE75338.1 hypothetical protein P8S53_02745 [Roseinatronobacter sp. S2]
MGVLGAGGALPTGWMRTGTPIPTVNLGVVGFGQAGGLPYVDLQIAGTPDTTGTIALLLAGSNAVFATSGQVWAGSVFLSLVAGSLSGISGGQIGFRPARGYATPGSTTADAASVSITPSGVVERYSHVVTLAAETTAFVAPQLLFVVTQGVPVDVTLRISAPQLEQASAASGVQIARAGGFDVTEPDQRNLWYLQPDGVDDWMQLTTAFSPPGRYTLAAALGGVVDPVFGNTTSATNALRFRTLTEGGGQLRHDIAAGRSLVVTDTRFAQRNVVVSRVSSTSSGEVWLNGDVTTAWRTGDLSPISGDALFRFGNSFGTGRFYGGALISEAVSTLDRLHLQKFMTRLAGVSL